jgi:zinc protease
MQGIREFDMMHSKKSLFVAIVAFFAVSLSVFADSGAVPAGAPGSTAVGAVRAAIKNSSLLEPDGSILSGTLPNGISWRVARNAAPANRVFLRLVVKAGSALEADDQRGVAHLIEHMAFNGTEHFAANELVDYFESIGMAFGPEVNAYTGFDETVFMLEIPADDPKALDKALLVLRDWACAITFDPAELEKERGVVIEEWRLGRGAQGRVQDKEVPFLFEGSRYATRLPIGDPEIVKNAPAQRILDFYHQWYRPELMTVVLVGDADPSILSSAIARSLASVPPSAQVVKRPEFPGSLRKKSDALVIRDPELTYSSFQLLEQGAQTPVRTVGDFRARLVESMAVSILNRRLDEKTLQQDPVLLGAQAGFQKIIKPTRFAFLGAVPVKDRFAEAFNQSMEELARARAFGVTEDELAREKASLLDDIEQAWLNRDKVNSETRAGAIVQSVLSGDPALSLDERRDLYGSLVPAVTPKDVNAVLKGLLAGKGTMLVASAPDSATDVPDSAALLALWKAWKPAAPLAPYAETGLARPLFSPLPDSSGGSTAAAGATAGSQTGTIVAERQLSANGIREWTLSNGARVVWYKTDFKANEILFNAVSSGGTSLVSDADFPSASEAVSYADLSGLNGFSSIDLQKKLAGKTVSVNAWVQDTREGLSGMSSVADLETLFQLVNLKFTRQTFTPEAWQSLIKQLQTLAASRESSPGEMFSDLKVRLLYGDSVRYANVSRALIERMDPRVAESAYRARFADAADFTFVFVGSLDEAKLRDFSERYLATLPGAANRETARDERVPFPKGIRSDMLKKGIDPQSDVFIAFGGKPEIGKYEYELFGQLLELLDIRFREVVREKMSGSYGVSADGFVTAYPVPAWELTIDFGCEPGREDALSAAVLDEIRKLASAPVPDVYISKLREGVRRSQETGLKNNGFWVTRIAQELLRGRNLDGISDTEGLVQAITGESMRAMVAKYLPTDNYVKAVLEPEGNKVPADQKK